MRKIRLGKNGPMVPVIGTGCLRIKFIDQQQAEKFIMNSLEQGCNFFDHADCYAAWDGNGYYGECEEFFANSVHMTPSLREKMILQTKCGLVDQGYNGYDFSKDYIIKAAEGSIKRLKAEYLDVLLLHIPDALYEPEEIAEAFDYLQESGKVRHFGVSNFTSMSLEYLRRNLNVPILTNQMQFGLGYNAMIQQNLYANMPDERAVNRDGGILDYCRMNDITIQCWSPLQYRYFKGAVVGHPDLPELNAELEKVAEKYGVSPTTIAMAWILKHPAHMQPITGTMNIEHFNECAKAADIELTRKEWYDLFFAAGNWMR